MRTPDLGDGLELMSLAYDVISGKETTPMGIGRRLAGIAVNFIPVDELRAYLTEAAQKRDDIAVDLVEDAKFHEDP